MDEVGFLEFALIMMGISAALYSFYPDLLEAFTGILFPLGFWGAVFIILGAFLLGKHDYVLFGILLLVFMFNLHDMAIKMFGYNFGPNNGINFAPIASIITITLSSFTNAPFLFAILLFLGAVLYVITKG